MQNNKKGIHFDRAYSGCCNYRDPCNDCRDQYGKARLKANDAKAATLMTRTQREAAACIASGGNLNFKTFWEIWQSGNGIPFDIGGTICNSGNSVIEDLASMRLMSTNSRYWAYANRQAGDYYGYYKGWNGKYLFWFAATATCTTPSSCVDGVTPAAGAPTILCDNTKCVMNNYGTPNPKDYN